MNQNKDHPYIGVDGIIRNEKGEILLMHRTAGGVYRLLGLNCRGY